MRKDIILMVISIIILVSCTKSGDQKENEFPEVIELIKGGDYFHAGNLTPMNMEIADGVASISFF